MAKEGRDGLAGVKCIVAVANRLQGPTMQKFQHPKTGPNKAPCPAHPPASLLGDMRRMKQADTRQMHSSAMDATRPLSSLWHCRHGWHRHGFRQAPSQAYTGTAQRQRHGRHSALQQLVCTAQKRHGVGTTPVKKMHTQVAKASAHMACMPWATVGTAGKGGVTTDKTTHINRCSAHHLVDEAIDALHQLVVVLHAHQRRHHREARQHLQK